MSPGVLSLAASVPSDTLTPRRCRSAILKSAIRPRPSEKNAAGHHTIWQPDSLDGVFLRLVQHVCVDDDGMLVQDAHLLQVHELACSIQGVIYLRLPGYVTGVQKQGHIVVPGA